MKLVNGVTYTFCKRSLNFEPPVTPFNQLTWRLRHLVWNNSFMYQNVRTLFCCVCYHSLVYLCCVWANPCVKAQEEITRLTNATQTADPDPNFLVCNWYSSLIKLAIILKIPPTTVFVQSCSACNFLDLRNVHALLFNFKMDILNCSNRKTRISFLSIWFGPEDVDNEKW